MRLSIARLMPVSKNMVRRPRRFKQKYSDAWHIGSEITIKDEGYRAACESRGIHVYNPTEVFRPYLPDLKLSEEEEASIKKNLVEKKAFTLDNEHEHPNFQNRNCKTFDRKTMPSLNQALNLTNTALFEGLPTLLQDNLGKAVLPEGGEKAVQQALKDSRMFDAMQIKLPKNVFVPHIGWNSVIDRMNRPLPYPEPEYSFGRNVRREYGIPNTRKSMTFIRNLFLIFDSLAGDYPRLLNRVHLEDCFLRQFFEKDEHYVRVMNPLHFVIADENPLKPYVADVEKTKQIDLPDIYPENSVGRFVDNNVARQIKNNIYINENAFPFIQKAGSCAHIHTCVEVDASLGPLEYTFDSRGRSLVLAFSTALGQARLLHGESVSGQLSNPITVNFISTNGQDFLLTVFQMNTLDLSSPVKNIVWQKQLGNIFGRCDFIEAVPTLEDYNHDVVKTLLSVYKSGL